MPPYADAMTDTSMFCTVRCLCRGRCTAPLLVDRVSRQIVSNESADIVRMLNDMQLPGCTDVDLYPARLRPNIDALNDKV